MTFSISVEQTPSRVFSKDEENAAKEAEEADNGTEIGVVKQDDASSLFAR
jgi:hypothetical protein